MLWLYELTTAGLLTLVPRRVVTATGFAYIGKQKVCKLAGLNHRTTSVIFITAYMYLYFQENGLWGILIEKSREEKVEKGNTEVLCVCTHCTSRVHMVRGHHVHVHVHIYVCIPHTVHWLA